MYDPNEDELEYLDPMGMVQRIPRSAVMGAPPTLQEDPGGPMFEPQDQAPGFEPQAGAPGGSGPSPSDLPTPAQEQASSAPAPIGVPATLGANTQLAPLGEVPTIARQGAKPVPKNDYERYVQEADAAGQEHIDATRRVAALEGEQAQGVSDIFTKNLVKDGLTDEELAPHPEGVTVQQRDEIIRGRNQKLDDERNREVDRRQGEVEAEAERTAQMQVQPGRIFQDQHNLSKVAGVLTFGLGGLMRVMGHGNSFAKAVDDIIDQDLKAQEANIANAQQSLATKKSLLQSYLEQTGNLSQAREKARAALWQSAVNQAEIMKMGYSSKIGMARADEAIAALKEGQANSRATARLQFNKDVRDEQNDRVQRGLTRAQTARLNVETKQAEVQAEMDAAKARAYAALPDGSIEKETFGMTPVQVMQYLKDKKTLDDNDIQDVDSPDKIAVARTEEGTKKSQGAIVFGTIMTRNLAEMSRIIRDAEKDVNWKPGSNLWNETERKLAALHTQVIEAAKNAGEMGAYDNGVKELYDNGIGDPNKKFDMNVGASAARWDAVARLVQDKTDITLRAYTDYGKRHPPTSKWRAKPDPSLNTAAVKAETNEEARARAKKESLDKMAALPGENTHAERNALNAEEANVKYGPERQAIRDELAATGRPPTDAEIKTLGFRNRAEFDKDERQRIADALSRRNEVPSTSNGLSVPRLK